MLNPDFSAIFLSEIANRMLCNNRFISFNSKLIYNNRLTDFQIVRFDDHYDKWEDPKKDMEPLYSIS